MSHSERHWQNWFHCQINGWYCAYCFRFVLVRQGASQRHFDHTDIDLCQGTAGCVLQASSGSSVWGDQCHAQTSQWTLAGTAHQAANVHTGLSSRWVRWLTCTHIYTVNTVMLLMVLHITRMVCVCGSLTVAVMWMDSSTDQETLCPQTATTGTSNWL